MADAHAEEVELRLVVLGRSGARRWSVIRSIVGLQDEGTGPKEDVSQEGSKHRGEAAGRQVVVSSSPDWFSSDCDPEERRRHLSSLIARSSPGPHAFLLCVPVNEPADGEAKALDTLEKLLGVAAVRGHTAILFTHMEELDEDERLEDYLATWRKDLRALVDRCGGRYHTLEARGGLSGEREAVEEMLAMVEEVVRASGGQRFSSPLYQEAEERVRMRQVELARQRRGEGPDDQPPPMDWEPTAEDLASVREEAEGSVGGLSVDVDDIFPPTSVSPSSPSFLWGLWEKLSSWIMRLPKMVRREALLGALVGLFVGGPFGGMVGATVGSVATEVGRRKTKKTT